jgi:hypothetical protein
MIKYLERNNKKRFALLPQIKLSGSYISFVPRLMSVMYDEWIDTLQNKIKITNEKLVRRVHKIDPNFVIKKTGGIKYFEADYKNYYKQLFNLHKFDLDRYNHNVISFSTDGYSVCIKIEKPKI